MIERQESVEQTALKLFEAGEPQLARKYLTYYSGTEALNGWRLGEALANSIEARTESSVRHPAMRLHGGALVAAVTLCAGCSPALQLPADTIVVNGKVITVDTDDSITEALAIRDGKIVALGSTHQIEALAGDATRRIDLGGLTATPGLIDTHKPFRGRRRRSALHARRVVPGGRVDHRRRGGGSRRGRRARSRRVDHRPVDGTRESSRNGAISMPMIWSAVSPDNPVWLTHTTAHYSVGNSLALDLAGVTRDTPDPPGGVIDRQPDGTPTGVFKDTATSLVRRPHSDPRR